MIRSKIKFRSSRCLLQSFLLRDLSTTTNDANKLPVPSDSSKDSRSSWDQTYKQLQNLDFTTAAKILFSDQQKKKKFGLDFHLVQLFFACMPSLAVYLVAQYARSEIRKMEAEEELKRKQKELEEEKEKEAPAQEDTEKEAESASSEQESYSELHKVKVRLDALEETIKEIVDEKMKLSASLPKDQKKGESTNQNTDIFNKASSNQNNSEGKPQSRNKVAGGPPKTDNDLVGGTSKQVMDEKGAASEESKRWSSEED